MSQKHPTEETQRRRKRRRKRRRAPLRARLMPLALLCLICVGVPVCCTRALSHRQVSKIEQSVGTSFTEALDYMPTNLRKAAEGKPSMSHVLEVAEKIRALTIEQRVAQLFIVTPESLLKGKSDGTMTAAGELTREALRERPVGGLIYFKANLVTADQTSEMLANTAAYAMEACGIPILLTVDEEGGTVSRIGGNDGFDIDNVGNMCDVGATGDTSYAQDVAIRIGSYLYRLGFTANFAPVADVANNPDSDTMVLRSFGSDARLVADMITAQVTGFRSQRIICCAKHFPGIGAAEGDSHDGAIYTSQTAEDMMAEELIPFKAAIDAGAPMVMVGHISCPNITGNDLPASVSPEIMEGLLRDQLGYKGVIITDSLSMGAIVNVFGKDRVAVEAFKAGADALLMPPNFEVAYQGMLDAVESGEISQERLSQSVWRVVSMKLENEWY